MNNSIPVDSQEIATLLRKACPERADEIAGFWQQFEPEFAIKSDGVGIKISANANKVTWMNKVFIHEWVVVFAGYAALAVYGPYIWLEGRSGEITFNDVIDEPSFPAAEEQLENYLYFAKIIRETDDLASLEWTVDIPEPTSDIKLMKIEHIACSEIIQLSTAVTFLHELRHVQFTGENNRPTLGYDEERVCDKFSREMLFDQIGAYSDATGEDMTDVKSKRLIGLASAAFSIAMCEPSTIAAAIQDTHPPIKDRFDHMVIQAEVPETANGWLYVACLLISLLRQSQRLPRSVCFTSRKDLCQQLVKCL